MLEDFQSDRTAALASLDRLLNLVHEVVGLFVDREVGVSGDAERANRFDLVQLEKLFEVIGDDILQQHEAARALVLRQLCEAGKNRRNLHDGKALFTFVFFGGKPYGEVQALVCEHRERTAAIHLERRQHREQDAVKIRVDKPELLVIHSVRRQKFHVRLLFQHGENRAVQAGILFFHKCMRLFFECRKQFLRCEAGIIGFRVAGIHLAFHARHAHHKEFVEV